MGFEAHPPGPKWYPIISNEPGYPRNTVWDGFAKMVQKYGER